MRQRNASFLAATAVGWLGIAALTGLLLATGAGSDAGYASRLGWPLAGVAILTPLAGLVLTARRVTRRLEVVQERTNGPGPGDPQRGGPSAGKAR